MFKRILAVSAAAILPALVLAAPAPAATSPSGILQQKGTRGDSVDFKYTEGSSHSQDSALGIGISGKGIDAGYTTDGSHASTATRADGYGAEHHNTWFRTEFNTGQYRAFCVGVAGTNVHRVKQKNCPKHTPGGSPVHMCLWMIHSRGWFGGASTQHPKTAPRTPRADCAPQGANSSFHGDFGSAIKWSHGFELGATLGIKGIDGKASFNTTAHTGYDTNAVMNFNFQHKGHLCGTNRGPAHAAILVARSNLPAR